MVLGFDGSPPFLRSGLQISLRLLVTVYNFVSWHVKMFIKV